jgi:hypothetical protein
LVGRVGALALWILLPLVGASTAGAQAPCAAPACVGPFNCNVDASGDDVAGCCTAATPCKTIEFALAQVSAGAVIKVAAGTYPSLAFLTPLTIHKTVTLCGAQAGVDARNPRGPESIIANEFGTTIFNATPIPPPNNVIVDGFTFQGVTFVNPVGFGLDIEAGAQGTQVYNNIFQNNIAGIGLGNTGPSQMRICKNLFLNNNQNPPPPPIAAATGTGIYADEFVCGAVCTNFLIEQNTFTGNDNAGIDFSNSTSPITNVEVSTNTFDMNSRSILLFSVHQSTIHNNRFTNSTGVGSGDIRIFGGVDGLMITNNDMSGGAGWAIRMSSDNGPSSNIMIHENNIASYAGTPPTTMFGGGLVLVDADAYPTTLDATCNWWSDPCGPFNVTNNPLGPGQEVQEATPSNVHFSPWLIAPGPAPGPGTGTCSGTAETCRLVPSTTSTTTSSTTTSSLPGATTTTSTPAVPSTSTTLPPEICGNCLDDNGNGLIDGEDPACCPTVQPLVVTQSSFRAGRVRVRAKFPEGTFAGFNPRHGGVHLQARGASGEVLCCTIPGRDWQNLFQHTFGFFEQTPTVCPPIKCMNFALPKKGQPQVTFVTGQVSANSPLLSPLKITISADDQCAAGPVSLAPKLRRGGVLP